MKLKGCLDTLTEITGVFIEYFMEINYLQKGISVESLKYLYRLKGFCSILGIALYT